MSDPVRLGRPRKLEFESEQGLSLPTPKIQLDPGEVGELSKRLRKSSANDNVAHGERKSDIVAIAAKRPLSKRVLKRIERKVAWPIAVRGPAIDPAQADLMVADIAARVGVAIRIDWGSSSDVLQADFGLKELRVPGGATKVPGLSLDALAIQILHEIAHVLNGRSEVDADDWAVRVGLPLVFGPIDRDQATVERWLKAAYTSLADQIDSEATLSPKAPISPLITVFASSYAALQGRFDIYRSGILGLEPPTQLHKKDQRDYPELVPIAEACALLKVPEDVLLAMGAFKGGLKSLRLEGGVAFERDRLTTVALLVRNKAQLAIAQAERGQDEASILAWIGDHAADFADRFENDPELRRLVFSEWRPDGTNYDATLAHWRRGTHSAQQ